MCSLLCGGKSIAFNSILILQKKALRTILYLNHPELVKKYFSEVIILTLYGMYVFENNIAVKTKGNRSPKLRDTHQYNKRSRKNWSLNEVFRKRPSSAGTNCMYNVPKKIADINDLVLKTSKKVLK